MNVIIFGGTGMVGQGVLSPLMPWLRKRFPQYVTTTEQLGRAMIAAAKYGAPKSVLENADINNLGYIRV